MKTLLRLFGGLLLLGAVAAFVVWVASGQGAAKLTWQRPDVKKSIHTFAYKVYANPRLQDGRFFLSKLVLKNEGNLPARDFNISYEIPGYIARTTPETLPSIPPGHTVVELFYPQFPESVTKIKNQTAATLEIHLSWKESSGAPREEILRDNFDFRGVNEIEYTDIPADEIVSPYDLFVNDSLLAAMVTPNDPVVAEFAAAITEKLGGAVAGAGGVNDAVEALRGTYEYMTETGMRYAGAKGVPEIVGNATTTVQTIRLPRDVILTNNGLCIELALLWASVLEHLGIQTFIEMLPGHALVGVVSEGNFIPVECTAITPKSVGANRPVSFDNAVKMAQGELEKVMKEGSFYKELNVRDLQASGIRPPELPDIDVDRIKTVLASRAGAARQQEQRQEQTQETQNAPAQPPEVPEGFSSWTAPDNSVLCAFPSGWLHGPPGNPNVPELIFGAYDNSKTYVGVEVYFTNATSDPGEAMDKIAKNWRRAGVRVKPSNHSTENGITRFSGTASNGSTTNVWTGYFRPTSQGCVGVCIGVPKQMLSMNQNLVAQLISQIYFP